VGLRGKNIASFCLPTTGKFHTYSKTYQQGSFTFIPSATYGTMNPIRKSSKQDSQVRATEHETAWRMEKGRAEWEREGCGVRQEMSFCIWQCL
jgi:hypothetical protein